MSEVLGIALARGDSTPSLAVLRVAVLAPYDNNSNAVVVLDGSLSSDGDDDALTYVWFDGSATSPFAVGSNVTSRLAVDRKSVV